MSGLTKKQLISCLNKYYQFHGYDSSNLKSLSKKDLEKLLVKTHKHLEGSGIFDSVKNVYKEARERISGAIYGRDNFSPAIRKFLELYGNNTITRILACRDPVKGALETTLNLISLGEYEKNKKELKYDLIFHLYLLIEIKSDQGVYVNIRVEKNEQIGIFRTDERPKEFTPIDIKQKITLGQFLENGIKSVSKNRFFSYNFDSNNCQDFIKLLLDANKGFFNITSNILNFVKQNTTGIITGVAKKLGVGVTDLAHRFRVLIEGTGHRKKRKSRK